MQAILTRYLPATNTKPSRIKAWCERGSITISYPDHLSGDSVYVYAVNALIAKFVLADEKEYGTPPKKNPWAAKRVCGQLPTGDYAHVFVRG